MKARRVSVTDARKAISSFAPQAVEPGDSELRVTASLASKPYRIGRR